MTGTAGRVRMSPDGRREQLLDLGVRLLSTRSLDELSIEMLAEEAGISRGLLYHYFGNKQDFHRAVVPAGRRRPDPGHRAGPGGGARWSGWPARSTAYVDYVAANYAGYTSLVRGAASGNPDLQEIYEEARAALTDRIFDQADGEAARGCSTCSPPSDTPAVRLMVRGWSAMAEDVVIAWVRDDRGVSKDDLLALLAAALPGVLAGMP